MKEAEDPNPNPPNNSTTAQISQTPTQNLPPQKQASLIQEGIDLAVEQLLKEINVKVMTEVDDGDKRKHYSPPTEEELIAYNSMVESTNKFHQSSVSLSSSLETSTGDDSHEPSTVIEAGVSQANLGGSTSPIAPQDALTALSQAPLQTELGEPSSPTVHPTGCKLHQAGIQTLLTTSPPSLSATTLLCTPPALPTPEAGDA